jgi:hypothetical protein
MEALASKEKVQYHVPNKYIHTGFIIFMLDSSVAARW